MRRFYLHNLGCPKNRVDAEWIWAAAASRGLVPVDDPAEAEVVVVNTCAFVQAAVQESLDTIVELAGLRSGGRCQRLIVAGCLTARYREQLLSELPEVDLFVGPAEVGKLAAAMASLHPPRRRLRCAPAAAYLPRGDAPRVNSLSMGAAYLKIAEGCSRRCSFCIIPALRGPQRSRPLGALVREAEALVRLGVGELVLVAQDLTAWGRDLPHRPALADLVEALAAVPGLWWLRLMYLYPDDLDGRLLRVVAERQTVLPYLDVPLQHVEAGVLRRMRRGGHLASNRELVTRLRAEVPGVVLRTTLMTGFPGEDRRAFAALVRFVEWARFERLGVFAFSPEAGTRAAGLAGAVASRTAARRRRRLLEAQQPLAEAYHASLVGTVQEVLIEGATEDGTLLGRCWNQAPEVDGETRVRGPATIGEIVPVRITGSDVYDLEGEALAAG